MHNLNCTLSGNGSQRSCRRMSAPTFDQPGRRRTSRANFDKPRSSANEHQHQGRKIPPVQGSENDVICFSTFTNLLLLYYRNNHCNIEIFIASQIEVHYYCYHKFACYPLLVKQGSESLQCFSDIKSNISD